MILLFISAPAFTQDTAAIYKDYPMEELVVTASRTGSRILESPVSTQVITRGQLEDAGLTQLEDILIKQGGLEVKDYGGSGGAKLLSLRGSTAEQVLVLIDGIRINSTASGVADLGLYDLEHVERIEIVRGGSSGLYGSDAVGGVVNIITKREGDLSRLSAGTEFQTSSFNSKRGKIFFQFPLRQWNVAGVYSKAYQPDSSYKVNEPHSGKTITRVNASTRNDGWSLNIGKASGKMSLHWMNRFFSRRSELPNTIDNNTSSLAQAEQRDVFLMSHPQIAYKLSDKTDLKFSAAYVYAKIAYENGRNNIDDFTKTYTWSSESRVRFKISRSQNVAAGYFFSNSSAKGTNIMTPDERLHSVFAEDQIRFTFSRSAVFEQLHLYPFMRWDRYSIYGNVISPKLGVNLSKRRALLYYALRASISRNFRAPTFNERFWSGDGALGNDAIKPERSITMDAGVTLGLEWSERNILEWNAGVYRVRTEKQIVWQQGAIEPSLWSPVNLASTLTHGVEVAVSHRYTDAVITEMNYTYNRAMDVSGSSSFRLRYSPLHSLKFSNTVSVKHFTVSQHTRYTSRRFVSADNASYLNPYWMTDLYMSYNFKWNAVTFKFFTGVNNLFDTAYETVALYPGLAREFTIGLSVTY